MKTKVWLIHALTALLFTAGILILLYAPVSKYLMKKRQLEISVTYETQISGLSEEVLAEEWRIARAYNDILAGRAVSDDLLAGSGKSIPDNYYGTLNVGGVMGIIRIPDIDLNLPIYHGTGEASLQKGAGHIAKTALPTGGIGNHPVLTGHRALTNAEMFDGLVKLKRGDMFYLEVLGETLAYQIDQIKVVEPDDLRDLKPAADKDYVTLITCTPYAVNSHRLLVRGVRTSGAEEARADEQQTGIDCCWLIWILIVLLLLILLRRRRRSEKAQIICDESHASNSE